MICPNCKKNLEDTDVYCIWCGINIPQFVEEQTSKAEQLAKEKEELKKQQQPQEQQDEKKTMSTWGRFLTIIIFVFTGIRSFGSCDNLFDVIVVAILLLSAFVSILTLIINKIKEYKSES